jgi:hypothetical protein
MHELSSTIPIAYPGGTYGTYLEWCLTSLTSTDQLISPFSALGSSHSFEKKIVDFDNILEFLSTNQSEKFIRFHPKTQQQHLVSNRLDQTCAMVQHMIYIYPDRDSVLLTINNFFTKVFQEEWWTFQFLSNIDPLKIYQNWPVTSGTAIQDIPDWIQREFLSLYFMPAWYNQVEWYHPDRWQNPKCCTITVGDLLNNFEETLQKIKVFCNLEYVRPVQDLLPFHEQNLKNQKYLHHDALCTNIIQAVINNQNLSWEPLSLPSEAWIQWQLRNLGYEIQCHALDKFPTNSVHLHELLYQPEST